MDQPFSKGLANGSIQGNRSGIRSLNIVTLQNVITSQWPIPARLRSFTQWELLWRSINAEKNKNTETVKMCDYNKSYAFLKSGGLSWHRRHWLIGLAFMPWYRVTRLAVGLVSHSRSGYWMYGKRIMKQLLHHNADLLISFLNQKRTDLIIKFCFVNIGTGLVWV